jgi:hypothetical protein
MKDLGKAYIYSMGFVDYRKRDASLPAGCKNLADVLPGEKTPAGSEAPPDAREVERSAGTYARIPSEIAELYRGNPCGVLEILSPANPGHVSVVLRAKIPLVQAKIAPPDERTNEVLRRVLIQHGFTDLSLSVKLADPAVCEQQHIIPIFTSSMDIPSLSDILSEFFAEMYRTDLLRFTRSHVL